MTPPPTATGDRGAGDGDGREARAALSQRTQDLGSYPIVTLQHTSTTSCQVSDHIQWLFSESDNRIVPCQDCGAGAAVLEVIALDQAWPRAVEPFRRALVYFTTVSPYKIY